MSFPKVCIVGAGPAGFYAAQHLLKHLPGVSVDIFEKLPVPFGLVRYGVAPDHPEVKNVEHTFTKTAQNPKFNFFGNVSLGKDIDLKRLKECYHSVLLTYGAEEDRKLNIPGENLDNVLSARSFVGWYNGNPSNRDFNPDLSGRILTILGQGNVAIDIARIVLSPIDALKSTDITEYALAALQKSKIEEVRLVGRRGPLQAAYTIAELREMLKLPSCKTVWREQDFSGIEEVIPKLERPRKRLTDLMIKSVKSQLQTSIQKTFLPIFFRNPLSISKSSVKFAKTILKGDDLLHKEAVTSQEVEFLNTDLVVRSIGYKSTKVDDNIPFNDAKGVIVNKMGRVSPGVYTTGWLGTGPTGVILTTMTNAFTVSQIICEDISQSKIENKPGSEAIVTDLIRKNVQIVSWKDWEKIDQYEVNEGVKKNKPREKITDIELMLRIAA